MAADAGDLLRLHVPRTLPALRDAMEGLCATLLPGASYAALVDDQTAENLAVELAAGSACPFRIGTRATPEDWLAPELRRYPLVYRDLPIGVFLLADTGSTPDLDRLPALLAHYSAAVAKLKLDSAALAMVDHYCASLQAFEEGVVLFQEKERDVIAARFLQLVANLLRSQHAALLTFAKAGDTDSPLRIDQALGVPEALVAGLHPQRSEDWWPTTQVGKPVTLHTADQPATFPALPPEFVDAVHNLVTCPLSYHGITAGLALVFNVNTREVDFPLRLMTLRGLGELGAALLHRIQLEQEAVFAKKLETELGIAAAVQARLLPREPPHTKGFDYAWRSVPSRSIGGDYVDLLDSDDGGAYAIIADVSGHGINSALLMTSARAHFRAMVDQATPGGALQRLNAELHREVDSTGMFMTGAALHLAADGSSLRFASAGHNPVLLYRFADDRFDLLESCGPPLGLERAAEYGDRSVRLGVGDVLVLYSDGITEAFDQTQDEMFGEERLASVVRAHAAAPASTILERILAHAEEFMGRRTYDDDASLLVIKRVG